MANALTAEQIQALLSNQKSRGDYDAEIREFLAGGEAGILVPLDSGRFSGKDAKKVKTGLDNARKRTTDAGGLVHEGANNVKVIVSEDQVFLVNTAVAAGDEG
jgi:hypothetical protein